MLLSGREDEHGGSMAKAQRAWRTERDPRRAYALLSNKQQRTTLEGRVLHTLCSVRATAYQEAVDRLPPASRQLYVHAYQSWLWNRVVSRRLAVHGLRLRSGDLVLATGDEPEPEPAAAEDDAPPAVDDEAPTPAPALPGGPPDVRALTEAELAQHTIHELVLPLPGWAVRYPDNETADWYRELLEADGVDLSREHCDSLRQYSLAGAYRRVLARPDVGRWRIARYADPAVDLVASDVDALMGRTPPADDPSGPYRALLLQFTLPASCYATMALREITGMES
ncbi:pseudouridylate synthase 7 homolog [Pollicipes pollicipes]|uniref:pseudouridylate synthase 7 homolog n=1 Tax=Pollicipes pollicipes TaxID=41117 RepID=UPI001884DB01|nr:pseudouridylate synthase 7 homolog [Pollicipes pollicipes]